MGSESIGNEESWKREKQFLKQVQEECPSTIAQGSLTTAGRELTIAFQCQELVSEIPAFGRDDKREEAIGRENEKERLLS